jgi:penicillin-binding protein 2
MATLRDVIPATSARVTWLLSGIVFGTLTVALFRLQVIELSDYEEMARNNYVVEASIKAPRGEIVDRNGLIVAGSRQSFSICGIPRSMLRNDGEIELLAKVLGVEEEFIRSRLRPTGLSYRPTPIVRDVDFETLSLVEELFAELPDVMVVSEPARSYPRGRHFCHVVGYVGEVTQAEIDASTRDYVPGDFTGKAGIEKYYDDFLKGKDGQRYVQFSPGRGTGPVEVSHLEPTSPDQGMSLVLHVDDGLQLLAHSLLQERRGCVIALDVRTGGVLALASNPSFDPNLFATGMSDPDWQAILAAEGKPLINRAIQSRYPPGSVYKLVTAGAALEKGLINRRTRLRPCRGSHKFGNREFGCWKEEGHGTVDLIDAIAFSCDVYFYQLGERLSLQEFHDYADGWRMGHRTGIDLLGEVEGLVPNPDYYDRVYGERGWTRGLMLNLAIGQGELLIPPIQLVCFVAGVANGGEYLAPRCVRMAELDGKTVMFRGETVELGLDPSTIAALKESMLRVVQDPTGTGRAARLDRIKVAGKTGTAQNPHGDDHASFVCFAPYEEPEIAVFVLVENSGHGSVVAVPVAREMLSYYFGETPSGEELTLR